MQHRRFNQFFWMIVIIFIVYVGTLFYGVFAQANETVPHTKSNCVITQEIDPDTKSNKIFNSIIIQHHTHITLTIYNILKFSTTKIETPKIPLRDSETISNQSQKTTFSNISKTID